jgi:hypothetical protein
MPAPAISRRFLSSVATFRFGWRILTVIAVRVACSSIVGMHGEAIKHDSAGDFSQASNHITLQACRADAVFGTVSLGFDSEAGLAADALYKPEIDSYRDAGARVCELTRLAIDPDHGSKEVLGALFHLTYIFGNVFGPATDVFIEVNPRHVVFYKRMLHFRQIGTCRISERVNAPAVLLHLDVAHVTEQIERYGGTRDAGQRSLYPYFFSKAEEEGLQGRIASLPHDK